MPILSNNEIMQKLSIACKRCGELAQKARDHHAATNAVEPDHHRAPREVTPGPKLSRIPSQR